ncbi:MAG TPA: HAD family hydrolase [Candidatus Sulfomarinibacteraceae bacterium]|nr:HAD family hydrolase [Candidatus Sulfomarinibacteraceae bacterium]
MSKAISLVAIDLDGTLLTPDGVLSERNEQAIRRAQRAGVCIVLATGKSRSSAEFILERFEQPCPGVFTQGMTIYDANGDVWRETTHKPEIAAQIIRFAEKRQLPYLAYARERVLTPYENECRQRLYHQYDEPLAEIVGSVLAYLDEVRLNKIIVCDPVDDGQVRAALARRLGDRAHVTQAVSQFVEVLPAGASKGAGLHWLLQKLDVPPQQVMAIGDGENDIEMLQIAGLGVAMGNAHPRVKEIADHVVAGNDEDGVAQALERFVLKEGDAT